VLLAAAERDFHALRGMQDITVFADEIFGFHVQQAAEKLFKAWLALLGETYPPTHDLAMLVEMVKAQEAAVLEFDILVEYTSFAVQFRYGPSDQGTSPLNRSLAVRHVEALLNLVRSRLLDS
ncbi:MAG: HEPN domain-containing protein, partial [Gemmatimonadetes bacterium]|nr:HEPN domain-containing protein [Gemmatimonadota bacterium]